MYVSICMYCRASEASETLSGLFNRDSRYMRILLVNGKEEWETNNNNRPINLPKVITFFTDYKYNKPLPLSLHNKYM